MRRWPVRSALYIDFENLPLPPEAIANWLAWLEDGVFDTSGRRRRFLQKRVYWNSHAERHRELFERHGFVSILIGKFSGLKNGADIRMAMDVVEATYTRSEIDEYILLTGDSDFVPVLDRLREKTKRSAIVATEHRPNIHTTYHLHADVLISARRLATEAPQYRRPGPGFLARLFQRSDPTQSPARPKPAVAKAPVAARAAGSLRPPPELLPKAPSKVAPLHEPHPAIDSALARVVDLLSRQPRNYMAQKRVLAELDQVPGFKRQGGSAYLGLGDYRTLMRELAKRDKRITVVGQPGGGTGVVFMPAGEPQSLAPKSPPDPIPAGRLEADTLAATVVEPPATDVVAANGAAPAEAGHRGPSSHAPRPELDSIAPMVAPEPPAPRARLPMAEARDV